MKQLDPPTSDNKNPIFNKLTQRIKTDPPGRTTVPILRSTSPTTVPQTITIDTAAATASSHRTPRSDDTINSKGSQQPGRVQQTGRVLQSGRDIQSGRVNTPQKPHPQEPQKPHPQEPHLPSPTKTVPSPTKKVTFQVIPDIKTVNKETSYTPDHEQRLRDASFAHTDHIMRQHTAVAQLIDSMNITTEDLYEPENQIMLVDALAHMFTEDKNDLPPDIYNLYIQQVFENTTHTMLQQDEHNTIPMSKGFTEADLTDNKIKSIMRILNKILPFDDRCTSDEIYEFREQLTSQIHLITQSNLDQKQVKLKRSKLMQTDEWPLWEKAEDTMIDSYDEVGMYGEPIKRNSLPRSAIILKSLWVYVRKANGKFKARNVCDGAYILRTPYLRSALGKTYANSMTQTEFRIFIAITAYLGFIIWGADATNAFAHSPPPDGDIYMAVDEQYARRYNAKYPQRKPIDTSYVMLVKHALQGHPESPRLYETFMNEILARRGFRSSKHAPCIYIGKWEDKPLIMIRQCDDYAAGSASKDTAISLYASIDNEIPMVIETEPMPLMYGININQTRDYVQLTMETYIKQLEREYLWLQDIKECNIEDSTPITETTTKKLDKAELPQTEKARRMIEIQQGFKYRSLFGQLLFPMICCRVDISPHLSKLGQMMTSPAPIHFQALKEVAVHLVKTKKDGPMYWRPRKRYDLPDIPFRIRVCSTQPDSIWCYDGLASVKLATETYHGPAEIETEFRKQLDDLKETLITMADASYADNLRHRRSLTGHIHMLFGMLIDYKTCVQITLALSTAEAELCAIVSAGKLARWIRHILRALGFAPRGPTPLFTDNAAAKLVMDADGTTRRLRHVDVQKFAIQEWRQQGEISSEKVSSQENLADLTSKCTTRPIHARLILRIFAYHGPQMFRVTQVKMNEVRGIDK